MVAALVNFALHPVWLQGDSLHSAALLSLYCQVVSMGVRFILIMTAIALPN
jgi:hypothetical protein